MRSSEDKCCYIALLFHLGQFPYFIRYVMKIQLFGYKFERIILALVVIKDFAEGT